MEIKSVDKFLVTDIVDFWNRNIGAEFPMTIELFRQNTINDEFVCQKSSGIITNEYGNIIGLIIAKKDLKNKVTKSEKKTGWVQFILVDKDVRKQGVGSKLLEHVEMNFKKYGIREVFLGRDPHHYFPGIPAEYQEVIDWFETKSYKDNGTEYDLINRYQKNNEIKIPSINNVTFSLLDNYDHKEMLSFMRKEFPGRWTFELNEYLKIGGQGREFVVIKEDDKIIGFCRINDKDSPIIASNIYWSSLIDQDLGGVGPLGIAAEKRGLGYGIAIVEAGIAFLRKRDIKTIVIDWTGLVDFYKKLNYEPWKKYVSYSKEI